MHSGIFRHRNPARTKNASCRNLRAANCQQRPGSTSRRASGSDVAPEALWNGVLGRQSLDEWASERLASSYEFCPGIVWDLKHIASYSNVLDPEPLEGGIGLAELRSAPRPRPDPLARKSCRGRSGCLMVHMWTAPQSWVPSTAR